MIPSLPPKVIEARFAEMMMDDYKKGEELEHQKELERQKQSEYYQSELEGQLEEQERKRQEQYEEFLKEKLMIDEICRKIYEEDQREVEAKLEKQKATRQYIEEFKKKREEVNWVGYFHYVFSNLSLE